MQYVASDINLMVFTTGYGFADLNPVNCHTLLECRYVHFHYGAPVWSNDKLTPMRFLFDYLCNVIGLLNMTAIIPGIIIDNSSD
jgi:hypothetical protein